MTAVRVSQLVLAMLVGSGWWLWQQAWMHALLGLAAGAVIWVLWESMKLNAVLRWVNRSDELPEPRLTGSWGELVDRIRKLRKGLEQQRQESDQRLAEFMDAIQTSPNGVVLLDAQSRIEWSNRTAADLLGIQPERDSGQHATNLIRNPVFTAYLQSGDHSKEVLMDGVGPTPGSPRTLAVRLHGYGAGRKLLLTRDVTAQQQAELMRRDFVANVSHEIRTPLTVLGGFVETLQTLELDQSDRQRYLDMMAQQSQRMQTLVSDLLTLSRLEGSPLPGRQLQLQLRAWLEERIQEAEGLSSVLPGGGHVFELNVSTDADLLGNPDELTSAVSNLLSNAVRYTPAGGRIVLAAVQSAGKGLEISVTDTGPGIAPEHIPRLSERFYRVDRSRSRDTGGTGLGLAIVKHVVQRHGGQLQVQSKLGEGARFVLLFPADRVGWR